MGLVDRVLEGIRSLLSRLPGGAARLLLDGLAALAERGDPGGAYQLATRIGGGADEYYPLPRPRFPGFMRDEVLESAEAVAQLPQPQGGSGVDALEALRMRRSRRCFEPPLSLEEVSTILYHSVGVTAWWGGWPLRAYPTAGGLQPVEAYLVVGEVEGLDAGIYYYHPGRHALALLRRGDFRVELARICLEQEFIAEAPASVVLTVNYARSASKYAARGYKYALLDAGAAMENLYLAVEALGLATVAVGAFVDDELSELLGVDGYWEFPALVMPVGRRCKS